MAKVTESFVALILAVCLIAGAALTYTAVAPNHGAIETASAHGWHWVKCVKGVPGIDYPHLWVRKHDGTWVESTWGCGGHRIGDAWWQNFGDTGVGGRG